MKIEPGFSSISIRQIESGDDPLWNSYAFHPAVIVDITYGRWGKYHDRSRILYTLP